MQVSPLLVGALVAFLLAMTGIALGNKFWFVMIGEVNRNKTDDHLTSYFGAYPGKGLRMVEEYRKACPNGKAHLYLFAATALMFIGLTATALLVTIYGASHGSPSRPRAPSSPRGPRS